MMKKKSNLKLGRKIWEFVKNNKILSIASIVFVTFSGINILLIYTFVQVLGTI